jgi:hypothetical protein
MVAILLAPACIATRGLNVTIGVGTDPYIGSRWGNRDGLDAPQIIAILDDDSREDRDS